MPPILIKQLGKSADMTTEQMRREKDLIDQINRLLRDRDATLSQLTTVRTIAAGRVQMDGAGGFTIKEIYGCSLSIVLTNLKITFDQAQPTPLRYNVVGNRIGGGARAQHLSSYLSDSCIVQLTDTGGSNESFASVAISYSFTVMTF